MFCSHQITRAGSASADVPAITTMAAAGCSAGPCLPLTAPNLRKGPSFSTVLFCSVVASSVTVLSSPRCPNPLGLAPRPVHGSPSYFSEHFLAFWSNMTPQAHLHVPCPSLESDVFLKALVLFPVSPGSSTVVAGQATDRIPQTPS